MKSRWFGTMILSVAIAAVLALCGNRTVGASEKIETVTIELPGEVEMEFKKIPGTLRRPAASSGYFQTVLSGNL